MCTCVCVFVCECNYYSYFHSLVVEFSYGTRKIFQSEFFHLLGYYAVYRGLTLTFWDYVLVPYSRVKLSKMRLIYSAETSVPNYRRPHGNPENVTIRLNRCGSLRSCFKVPYKLGATEAPGSSLILWLYQVSYIKGFGMKQFHILPTPRMCAFSGISEKAAIISLYSVKLLVYCAVRSGELNIAH